VRSLLRIDSTVFVRFAVQVYGKAGDGRYRLPVIDQGCAQLAVPTLEAYPAGQRQIAIKPGIEQYATVNLDAQLEIAIAQLFR